MPNRHTWSGSAARSTGSGFLPGTQRSDRRIGYLTKYLTKSIAETYDPDLASKRQQRHRDRLAKETRWLPCSPDCANWLRFGVQPKGAESGMVPGECDKAAHGPDNLGHGGRRVLVSSQWSGKTIDQHKVDRARVVKEALTEAGVEMPERDRYAASATRPDGTPRYRWEAVDINPATAPKQYRQLVERSIREQVCWRREYDDAKLAAVIHAERTHRAARAHPPGTRSANHPDPAATAA